jgi:diguanylate cyclase
LLVDVDHFKTINESHGHKTGDTVLVEIARLLGTAVRRSDLICRLGGEEFILLCRRTAADEALRIAEKVRTVIAGHPFKTIDGEHIRVTVSVGVATFPTKDAVATATVEDYLHGADVALYNSKHSGRNRVTHIAQLQSPGATTSELSG